MDRYAIPATGPMDQITAVTISEFASSVVNAAKRQLLSNNGGDSNRSVSEAAATAAILSAEEDARRSDMNAENPRYPFLKRDGEFHLFYKWTVFCTYHQVPPNTISTLLSTFISRVSGSLPGSLDLVREDRAALIALLRRNSGSKESIQTTRAWMLSRAHSIMAIGLVCKEYAQLIVDEATSGADARPPFTRILHLIYVINDVFFNGASASTKGVYTTVLPSDAVKSVNVVACMWPQLPFILQLAWSAPNATDGDRDKLMKLLSLWKAKRIIKSDAVDSLLKDLTSNNPALRNNLPAPPLVSPYVHLDTAMPPPFPPLQPQPPTSHEGMQMRPPPTPSAPQPTNSLPPNPPFARPPPPQPPQSRFSAAPPPSPAPTPSAPTSSLPASLYLPAALLATAPPPQPPSSLFPDIERVSVGYMSNIMRTAIKNGHPKYTPVDLRQLSGLVSAPYIEPGRLEVRMSDFYNKTAELFECVDDDAPFALQNNSSSDMSKRIEQQGTESSGDNDDDDEEPGFDARIYGRA